MTRGDCASAKGSEGQRASGAGDVPPVDAPAIVLSSPMARRRARGGGWEESTGAKRGGREGMRKDTAISAISTSTSGVPTSRRRGSRRERSREPPWGPAGRALLAGPTLHRSATMKIARNQPPQMERGMDVRPEPRDRDDPHARSGRPDASLQQPQLEPSGWPPPYRVVAGIAGGTPSRLRPAPRSRRSRPLHLPRGRPAIPKTRRHGQPAPDEQPVTPRATRTAQQRASPRRRFSVVPYIGTSHLLLGDVGARHGLARTRCCQRIGIEDAEGDHAR